MLIFNTPGCPQLEITSRTSIEDYIQKLGTQKNWESNEEKYVIFHIPH